MTHGRCHFNDNVYFRAMVHDVLDISIKNIISSCIPQPVFFLPFLLFLTLQLEPPKFSHQKTRVTIAGIVPVFILLTEASIYTFLDLAFHLVDFVFWGGVWTPSNHTPFKLGFEIEVHLDQLFARQGWGQRSENLLVLLDELTKTGVKVHALHFLRKISLSMEVALLFFLFLHTPIVSGGSSSSRAWRPCWA